MFTASPRKTCPTRASATYEGSVYADAWAVNDPNDGTSRTRMLGALTLEANFGSSEVSGRIDELRSREPGETSYQPLGSGSFHQHLERHDRGKRFFQRTGWKWTLTRTMPASHYSAAQCKAGFYGPAAAEVAGVFSGNQAATRHRSRANHGWSLRREKDGVAGAKRRAGNRGGACADCSGMGDVSLRYRRCGSAPARGACGHLHRSGGRRPPNAKYRLWRSPGCS